MRTWGPWAHNPAARPCCSLKSPENQDKLDPYLQGITWDVAREIRANAGGNHCVLNHCGKGVGVTGVWDLFQAVLLQPQNMVGVEDDTNCSFTTSLLYSGSYNG